MLVRFGTGMVPAMVTEDRGPVGFRGRQIYRVRVLFEEPFEMESPLVDIEPDPEHPSAVA